MIIYLEGEPYELALPYVEAIMYLMFLPDFGFKGNEIIVATEFVKDKRKVVNVIHKTETVSQRLEKVPMESNHFCYYRPMLIPLNKDLTFDNRLTDIKDGTLVSGYTIRMNGTQLSIPKSYDNVPEFKSGKVELADTSGDISADIPWMHWRGALISAKPLVKQFVKATGKTNWLWYK